VNNSTNSGKKETSMPVQNGGLRLHQPPHGPMLLAQSSTNKGDHIKFMFMFI